MTYNFIYKISALVDKQLKRLWSGDWKNGKDGVGAEKSKLIGTTRSQALQPVINPKPEHRERERDYS